MSEVLLYLKCMAAMFGLSVAKGYWVAAGKLDDGPVTEGGKAALLCLLFWLFHRSYLADKARSEAAKAAAETAEVNDPQA
ncbi:hypothetical protein WJU23_01930 [Prosthecobacter sp. SYSU 5D2]|uniref:hypothetical protein n=1 Tax=Prosthecobacter sp. SYSU 5D2 TaxID=3134134 RepID=UPI0031FE9DE1